MAVPSFRTRSWSPGPGLRTPVPGLRTPVRHPMSGRDSCGDLTVRGVSTPVLRREKTISFVDKGRVDSVTNKENRYGLYDDRLLHWPLDYERPGARRHVTTKQTALFKPTPGDELVDKVRDKLTTGFYGVRHMFKANDPLGKGTLTRDALLRVVYNLCGYVTKEQFDRFLERLDLENHKVISFNDFVKCFQDNETVKKQWVIPNQKFETQDLRRAMYPEEHLRNLDNMYCDPYHSAPYAAAFIRDQLNTGAVNVRDVLPSACFRPEGMILAPQLREALAQLNVHLNNTEFEKFWSRFDKDNCGGLYTKEFYKIVGLTAIGHPKITTTTTTTSNNQRNASRKQHNAEIVTSWCTEERDGELHDVLRTSYNYDVEDINTEETQEAKIKQERTNDIKNKKKQSITNKKPPVPPSQDSVKISRQQKTTTTRESKSEIQTENVLKALYSKYDEPYNLMLEAFQLFDYLDDGCISKIDFRRVLNEFGFPITAINLDDFLSSCGVRTIRGQIRYKDFLKKYQNRENNGILNNILSTEKHTIKEESKTVNKTQNSEQIEAAVVEHLHGDYLNLVNAFRQIDSRNEGKVSEKSFKQVLEKQLGGSLSETQWQNLQTNITTEESGQIVYPQFLAKFQIEPRSWTDEKYGISPKHMKKVMSKQQPEVIDKLKHMASYMMKIKEKDEIDERTKFLQTVNKKIEEILQSKFHTFDKHYKDMDRKMTGRITKWQFGALLRLTGLILDQSELDRLWVTLKLAPDGMLSYSSLIQQFNPAGRTRMAWTSPAPYATEDNRDMIEQAKHFQKSRRDSTFLTRTHSAPNLSQRPDSAKSSVSFKPDTSKLQKRKEIMKKLQPIVSKNWEKLQQQFVRLDKYGYSSIGYMEMRSIMIQLQFGLRDNEIKEILDQFDLTGNGRFHYIAFLEAFYPHNNGVGIGGGGSEFEFFEEVNEMNPLFIRKQPPAEVYKNFDVTNAVYKMRKQLLREWQNLRRAFRKMDSNNDGYLEAGDFKKCLQMCDIDGTDEDLYHLFSQFDSNLTGKICYKEFLKTLLSVK